MVRSSMDIDNRRTAAHIEHAASAESGSLCGHFVEG